MKKAVTFLLCAAILLSIAACSPQNEPGATSGASPAASPTTPVTSPGASEKTEPTPSQTMEPAPSETPLPPAQSDDPNAEKPPATAPPIDPPLASDTAFYGQTLDEIMKELTDGVEGIMMPVESYVSSDMYEWYFAAEYIPGSAGYASESGIGTIAHCVSLLLLPEDIDAGAVEESIRENIDPRKWICVEAETTLIKRNESLILIVLSFEDTADIIEANYDRLYA